MKKYTIMCLLGLVFSCTQMQEDEDQINKRTNVRSNLQHNYSVSLFEAETMASVYFKNAKMVKPIVVNEDTLAYFISADKNNLLLAGDKRLNPIIASFNGEYDIFSSNNTNFAIWLESELDFIQNVKESKEGYDNEYIKLWDEILNTRDSLIPETKTDPEMKWCVVTLDISVRDTILPLVPHLLTTKWGQESPWNIHLPYDNSQSGEKCVLGCAPVAAGQILYYCHHNMGKPNGLYHTIYCSKSSINQKTTDIGFSRSNYVSNSSRWDDMALSDTSSIGSDIYVSDFLTDIGNRLNAEYSASGTSASIDTSSLRAYSIGLTKGNYSYNTVRQSLMDYSPVIIGAFHTKTTTGWLIKKSTYSGGHAWVIDGLCRVDRTYVYTKICEYTENWRNETEVYNSLSEIFARYPQLQNENEAFEVEGETLSTEYLLMNWGQYGDCDDGLYSIESNASWPGGGHNYQYKKEIYYGFH